MHYGLAACDGSSRLWSLAKLTIAWESVIDHVTEERVRAAKPEGAGTPRQTQIHVAKGAILLDKKERYRKAAGQREREQGS